MIFDAAQLGASVFGEVQFSGPTQYEIFPPVPGQSAGLMRSQYGWGQVSRRKWTRSESWERPLSREVTAFTSIVITTVSGALIGKIRTDIQKSIVNSLEFTIDENGCNDFILRLNKLPLFEILPFAMLSVNIGDTDFDWYKGILSYPDEAGTNRGIYEFRGFGLRRYLETLKADTDYSAGLDLTEIVDDLVQTWIAPFSPIEYVPAKIGANSGVVLVNPIEIGKFNLRQILNTLSSMASTSTFYYIWGVDGDGAFYWTRINRAENERTFHIGYNLNAFKPKTNYENIKNVINIQVQPARGSGDSGWIGAGIFNDVSSVAKYGRNELNKQVPAFFDSDEVDVLGNAILDDLSEPKKSANTNYWQALTAGSYLTQGLYRFINPLKDFQETVNDIDNESDFTIIGSGDLIKENDINTFMYANGSVKLTFTNSESVRVELDLSVSGIIKEIRFYLRATKTGNYLTMGCGTSVWNQITHTIDIPINNFFIPIIWDVSSENLRSLSKFAIEINQDLSEEHEIWIDKLDILFAGHKTYRMNIKRSIYRYRPGSSGVQSEFGELPDSLPDYVANLQALTEEQKFTGEIR